MQPPCQWKRLADRLGISSNRTQLILTLYQSAETLQIQINTLSYLVTQVALGLQPCINPSYFTYVRITNRSCTEFTRCIILYPLVLGIPDPLFYILKDAVSHKLTLYHKSDVDSIVQYGTITSDHSTAVRLFSFIQSNNCYYK